MTDDRNIIGGLLRGIMPQAVATGPVAVPSPAERRLPALHDTCQCHKGAGAFGREGWHLRRFDDRDVARAVDAALRELPSGTPDVDRGRAERAAEAAAGRYLGLPLAYERCPHYEAAMRQAVVERRGKRGGGGDDFLENL